MTQKQLIDQFCEFRGKCTTDDVVALNFAYEMLAPRWISVEEQKPKLKHENDGSQYSEAVIVTDGKYRTSANWVHNIWAGWYGWFTGGDEELKGVTHWMPLPQAPKSGSSEKPNNCKKKGGER